MKTTIVPLIGDPIENLYQLGLREREAFLQIEKRVTKLLSTNFVLQFGQDLVSRARVIFKKKEESFFDQCIASYSQGLGIDSTRYLSFLTLFELAAHYGQVFPELKGILPGCTSIFAKNGQDITHTRLLDFPLIGLFEAKPRFYYWQSEGRPAILTYSCEGLAPLFIQGVHASGMSFALHHKPGEGYHREGQSIFQIGFETLFETQNLIEFKREMKKKISVTKWSYLLLDKSGQALALDIDGPALNVEHYNLNDSSPLIFTNIPLHQDSKGHEAFLKFSEDRQSWLKNKLNHSKSLHPLDIVTDVEDQKTKKWVHPAATLSTVGAYSVNLTQGHVDVKEGDSALVSSDKILRLSLSGQHELVVLKEKDKTSDFEEAWKRASKAQSAFDQGEYDLAYHELQIARALIPHPIWKEIMGLYLCIWDFKFITNSKELLLVYKNVKALNLPPALKDQWLLLMMRLEKKLDLSSTVKATDLSPYLQELYHEERSANKAVFATWMKLIYPRLEILDVFSPHHK